MQIPLLSIISPSTCKEFQNSNDSKKEIILLATELGLLCQGWRNTDHLHFGSISASDPAVIFSDIWLLSPKLTACSGKSDINNNNVVSRQRGGVTTCLQLLLCSHFSLPWQIPLEDFTTRFVFPLCLFEERTSLSFSGPFE